eukprot:scaffold72363_cov19-Tisochrysis_lutea.AAC.1
MRLGDAVCNGVVSSTGEAGGCCLQQLPGSGCVGQGLMSEGGSSRGASTSIRTIDNLSHRERPVPQNPVGILACAPKAIHPPVVKTHAPLHLLPASHLHKKGVTPLSRPCHSTTAASCVSVSLYAMSR